MTFRSAGQPDRARSGPHQKRVTNIRVKIENPPFSLHPYNTRSQPEHLVGAAPLVSLRNAQRHAREAAGPILALTRPLNQKQLLALTMEACTSDIGRFEKVTQLWAPVAALTSHVGNAQCKTMIRADTDLVDGQTYFLNRFTEQLYP